MKKDRDAEAKHVQLDQELDRRLADTGRRLDGATTRGGIVIAAALVMSTISSAHTAWWWISVALSVAAALIAAFSTLWYYKGKEVPIRGLHDNLKAHSAKTLAVEIFDKKLNLLEHEETKMERRSNWLTLSYAIFFVAFVFAILAHVT